MRQSNTSFLGLLIVVLVIGLTISLPVAQDNLKQGANDSYSRITWSNTANQPPELDSIGAKIVNEGEYLTFNIWATDPDNDSLILLAENLPLNADFTDNSDGSGTFEFTPDSTQAGIYYITFIASDWDLSDSEEVEITVVDSDSGCQTLVLQADFNQDSADSQPDTSLPGLPGGDYIVFNEDHGTVRVRGSVGSLTSKPVELSHDTSLGSVPLSAYPYTDDGCDSMIVKWRSLVRGNGSQFCRCELRSSTGAIIASVEYRDSNKLTYNHPDSVLPVSYTVDVDQLFEVIINFVSQTTRLRIDGSPVAGFQNVAFVQTATNLGRATMIAQWEHLVFDDLSVYSYSCPDLSVQSFYLSGDQSAFPGEAIGNRVYLRVENTGSFPSPACTVSFYLSEDSVTIDYSDSLLVGGKAIIPTIAPGDSVSIPINDSMEIPLEYPGGPAYLGVIVDQFNIIPDLNISNNFRFLPIIIITVCPPITEPSEARPPNHVLAPRDARMYWNSCAPILLNAPFDNQLTDYRTRPQIGTRGPDYGEPVYISANTYANLCWDGRQREGVTPFWPALLRIWHSVPDVLGQVQFDFLNSRSYSSGTVYIQADLLFEEPTTCLIGVKEKSEGGSRNLVMIDFMPTLTVRVHHADGTWQDGNYESCQEKETSDCFCNTPLLMIFRMSDDPPNYDIWLDGSQLVYKKELPPDYADANVGCVWFGHIWAEGYTPGFYVDNLLVTWDRPGCPTRYDLELREFGSSWETIQGLELPLYEEGWPWEGGQYYEWKVKAYNPDWVTQSPTWDFWVEDVDMDEWKVGAEYVQYYNNMPCDGDHTDNDPGDRKGKAEDAWNFCLEMSNDPNWYLGHIKGNADAHERNWGWNDDDIDNGMDQVDFAYFGGHGQVPPPGPCFSHPEDQCVLTPDLCGDWGSTDLEWIAWAACQTLRSDVAQQWCDCFDFLHLIVGFHSNSYSQPMSDHYGKNFARRLMGHEDYNNTPYGIVNAWYFEVERSLRNRLLDWSPAYLAEDLRYYKECVWGKGKVWPDVQHDGWCIYTRDKGFEKFRTFNPLITDIGTAKAIGSLNHKGPIIVVPEDFLMNSWASPDSMPQMMVQPRTVDTDYVRAIATQLCDQYGLFCEGDISTTDSSKTYGMRDLSNSLLVYKASGGWEYINHNFFLVPPEWEPVLMSDSGATDSLQSFLVNAGWFPDDAVAEHASGFYMSTVNCTQGENPESSWYFNVMPYFGRRTEGYRVAGPGAVIDASYGHRGVIEYVCHGGWRDLSTGSYVDVITLEEALEGFNLHGEDVPIGGFDPLCDTFIVDQAEIGYWEPYADSSINGLDIVWIIDGWVVYNNDTSDYQLPIPARAPICGDVNGSGEVTIADVVYTINYVFKGGPAPFPVLRAGDVNCQNDVNIIDAVYMVNYLFKNGPAPGDPNDDGIPDC